MTQNFDNVTISRREYDELNRKAFAFDTYKRKVKEDKYLTDLERLLFLDEEKVDIMDLMRDVAVSIDNEPAKENPEEEGMEEFFSDEEWEKVVEIVEEEKE